MLQKLPKKYFSTFYTFSQYQKDVFAILSVVNFEIPACHRNAAVQYDFSRMRRGSLKMVW